MIDKRATLKELRSIPVGTTDPLEFMKKIFALEDRIKDGEFDKPQFIRITPASTNKERLFADLQAKKQSLGEELEQLALSDPTEGTAGKLSCIFGQGDILDWLINGVVSGKYDEAGH